MKYFDKRFLNYLGRILFLFHSFLLVSLLVLAFVKTQTYTYLWGYLVGLTNSLAILVVDYWIYNKFANKKYSKLQAIGMVYVSIILTACILLGLFLFNRYVTNKIGFSHLHGGLYPINIVFYCLAITVLPLSFCLAFTISKKNKRKEINGQDF
ncbi:hypothetical protein ACWXVL_01395 [Mycoplasma sp. 128]